MDEARQPDDDDKNARSQRKSEPVPIRLSVS